MHSDQTLFTNSVLTLYLLTPPTLLSLRFLTAPYGKHHRPGWGPTLPPSAAWCLMESPTLFLPFLLFPFGRNRLNPKSILLISPFLFHYFNRTIIYPSRIFKITSKGFPLSVALMAFGFNLLNGYVQARWLSHYADLGGDDEWFWWRFGGGLLVFGFGMVVNLKSDNVLLGLRGQGGGYRVPRGGWFEYVSCPNYFGEILEWLGWGVMTWSYAGFGFFLYTCANLVPRARATHQWYLDKFGEDYPKDRKCVIPFLY
ncbi:dehydrogenase [Lithospermum erythrorhizon]|uniref:Steroid 5-alpha-reductase DET2 n=1 Tax=Lithospermum erythrorhizon TaxID=34254 RepID=A0AAV3PVE6_LITER